MESAETSSASPELLGAVTGGEAHLHRRAGAARGFQWPSRVRNLATNLANHNLLTKMGEAGQVSMSQFKKRILSEARMMQPVRFTPEEVWAGARVIGTACSNR